MIDDPSASSRADILSPRGLEFPTISYHILSFSTEGMQKNERCRERKNRETSSRAFLPLNRVPVYIHPNDVKGQSETACVSV